MQRSVNKHHRRSIRLCEYDYSQPGAYCVTICTQNHECVYGEIIGDDMVLNGAGSMILTEWMQLAHRFPTIELDAHVVMPNHFHGIIVIKDIVGAGRVPAPGAPDVGAGLVPALGAPDVGAGLVPALGAPDVGAGLVPAPRAPTRGAPTLGDIVGAFKSITTNGYIHGVREQGWAPFDRRLWQRNYYEQIVRNEDMLYRICKYIETNPARWALDHLNPIRQGARRYAFD